MRLVAPLVAPLAAMALAGCAARTPLDLIPPQDLMMIEAAERIEAQSPDTLRTPQPEPDLAAQYRAALVEAGIAPAAADAPAPEAPAPPAARPATAAAPASPIPAAPVPASPIPAAPAPAAPTGPISVEEMLSRVRAQAGAKP